MRRVVLDADSLATILAALRWYQHRLQYGKDPTDQQRQMIRAIAEAGGGTVLSPEDIDELCEHLNESL